MVKLKAAITGIFAYTPDYILTNAELEKMVDTNDEWIVSRTGIKERRIEKNPNLAASDLGAKAVEGLLNKMNLTPSDIDLLICATATPDMLFPATANIICDKIGIKNGFGFDVSAACSGFLYGLSIASKFIESGSHKKIVVVGTDKMSSIVDYEDRRTCILFGDAAGAALLEPLENGLGIQDAILRSDGVGRKYLYLTAGGSAKPASYETVAAKEHYVVQDGQPVFKAAVKNMSQTVAEVMARNGITNETVQWIIPHQANKRIIDSVGRMLKIDPKKVMINIEKYGNTTNATIPLCIFKHEHLLKKGDNVVLTAFGGGFTWGATYIKWAYDGDKT